MKIQKEVVLPDGNQSFKLFEPRLRNHFFWHYHPEYELVYVEAATGIRHVGQHVSSYVGSDLVFIGSNIPHLNFDYGLKTDYKQIVVQLRKPFLGDAFQQTPEFNRIRQLLDRSYRGLSFGGETKIEVAEQLRYMRELNRFDQLLQLLKVFQTLAKSEEVVELNDRDTSVKLFMNDKIRMTAVYNYIHQNYNEHPDVNEIAEQVHLSTAAFCRYFKKQTNMTFTDFVNQYRITQSKTLLLQGKSVSEVAYDVGLESLSYFSKLFKKIVGMNASDFRKQYRI
ncbi:AraC family transcriptional regulator [Tunicatimonas pelagia]|uniref:AraC family transcriptional regulator n=1 Tax=Tunicatimonas pelagia TaxID=931531 RepID=UPI002665D17B|nr:AraC family transcriptional regulator [Tunicatimonas pelagia]WKN45691.1 AraC family transcriptional regulator [Tunicatimonas pelagia]